MIWSLKKHCPPVTEQIQVCFCAVHNNRKKITEWIKFFFYEYPHEKTEGSHLNKTHVISKIGFGNWTSSQFMKFINRNLPQLHNSKPQLERKSKDTKTPKRFFFAIQSWSIRILNIPSTKNKKIKRILNPDPLRSNLEFQPETQETNIPICMSRSKDRQDWSTWASVPRADWGFWIAFSSASCQYKSFFSNFQK